MDTSLLKNTPGSPPPVAVTEVPPDEDTDLQKAIALSLGEHEMNSNGRPQSEHDLPAGISSEDSDISRALEQSLLEGAPPSISGQLANRLLSRRDPPDWPVGIENVGNTCWFSVVIQSLFHLSNFRNLILNIHMSSTPVSPSIIIVKELRLIFAHLVGTVKKSVDPTNTLRSFKGYLDLEASGSNRQQDVTEFTSKLLEWVEDALTTSSRSELESSNAQVGDSASALSRLKDLFFGQIETVGLYEVNRPPRFVKTENFVQIPIQVGIFPCLYDALDLSLQSEISGGDTTSSDCAIGRGEQWVTKLPRVLILNLNRFKFNSLSQKPEKLHCTLEFPTELFVDRFMKVNQSETREKRRQTSALRARLAELERRLGTFKQYGSSNLPISEALLTTIEFARSDKLSCDVVSSSIEEQHPDDVEMVDISAIPQVSSSTASNSNGGESVNEPGSLASTASVIACIQYWKEAVDKEIMFLECAIRETRSAIDTMYDSSSLKTMRYNLHAVLVHEGQAMAGHYWCFIYRPGNGTATQRGDWLRCNDTVVTYTTLEDMQSQAFGGQDLRGTAYCLIYVDPNTNRDTIFQDDSAGEVALNSLPDDVKEVVASANRDFLSQLQNSDNIQTIAAGDRGSARPSAPRVRFMEPEKDAEHSSEGEGTGEERRKTSSGNTELDGLDDVRLQNYKMCVEYMNCCLIEHAPADPPASPIAYVNTMCSQFRERFTKQLSQDTNWRLAHIAVFAISLECANCVVNKCILESFIACPVVPPSLLTVQSSVQKFVRNWKWPSNTDGSSVTYDMVHKEFERMMRIVECFIEGFEHYVGGRFRAALPLLVYACRLNGDKQRSLVDISLLAYFRAAALIALSEELLSLVQSGDLGEQVEALRVANEILVPVVASLDALQKHMSSTQSEESICTALERVRNDWCGLLATEIDEHLREKLQDILSKLIEDSGGVGLAEPWMSGSSLSGGGGRADLKRSYRDLMLKLNEAANHMSLGGPPAAATSFPHNII